MSVALRPFLLLSRNATAVPRTKPFDGARGGGGERPAIAPRVSVSGRTRADDQTGQIYFFA
jgi:hypothetical protein